jgi:peptidoglycan lytic transglycosylase B
MRAMLLVAALLTAGVLPAQPPEPPPPDPRPAFGDWLEGVRTEARERGIRDEIIEQTLANLEPVPAVVERDSNQPEFVLTVDQYVKRRVSAAVARNARKLSSQHATVLAQVSRQYDVPASILVAVWGLESNFGRFIGVRPTIPTIATLAYEPRRAAFFRGELFSALDIVNRGDIELAAMKGSWAGAMGQAQFMPSTYVKYAVDFDRDGRRDIWRSMPDVFASIANYLKEHGWKSGQTWGREVKVPETTAAFATAAAPRDAGCRAVRNMSEPQPLADWQKLGVRLPNGGRLPRASMDASLVQAGKRSFLVYSNYETLLAYNCAHTYALSVGLLSDRIAIRSTQKR